MPGQDYLDAAHDILLSRDFSLGEMLFSETASRFGIDNTPSSEVVEALTLLAHNVLQPLRNVAGALAVTSGYRCPELNAVVGGSAHSQHMRGEAADLNPMFIHPRTLFREAFRQGRFDQLIWEHGTLERPAWVHVSFTVHGAQRGMVLRAYRMQGQTVYEPLYGESLQKLIG